MRKNTVMGKNAAKRYGNYQAMAVAAAAALLFFCSWDLSCIWRQ